jgi:hypothetical protein
MLVHTRRAAGVWATKRCWHPRCSGPALMKNRGMGRHGWFAGVALALVGCSDAAGVSCPDPGPAITTDPLLGAPAEGTDENGCRVWKPRRRVNGSSVTEELPWTRGGPIAVIGGKGSVEIVGGSASRVRVTYRPFVNAAPDASDDEVRALLEDDEAKVSVVEFPGIEDAMGAGVFSHNGFTHYGADLRVELPPAFDGGLHIEQEAGPVRVGFSGDSPDVDVVAKFGACDLAIGPRAAALRVYCDGVRASVLGVPPEFGMRSFDSFEGDVAVSFAELPMFTVFQVQARAGGGVDTGNAESAACTVSASPAFENGRDVRCGGASDRDPRYSISAGPSGSVSLSF